MNNHTRFQRVPVMGKYLQRGLSMSIITLHFVEITFAFALDILKKALDYFDTLIQRKASVK